MKVMQLKNMFLTLTIPKVKLYIFASIVLLFSKENTFSFTFQTDLQVTICGTAQHEVVIYDDHDELVSWLVTR